jgi:hypothetical protein
MAGLLDRPVERPVARMIAYKRIATGTASIALGAGLFVVARLKGAPVSPLLVLGLAIFLAGGAWTLRDGLRVYRLL